jgi:ENTH domain
LVKNGSERVIEACRDKIYKIRSLENFNFYEGTLDRGSGVREKSKQIVELLGSNEMIRTEREKASSLRNKFVGIGNDGSRGSTGSVSSGNNYSGGGSGGGSYGGDRGFGSSYSDSHSNSNGGGHDNYSSNSNSRYIHDSYDASRGGGGSGGSGSNGSKYRDDEPKYSTETIAAPKKKSYDEDEEDVKVKHKSKSTSKLAAPTSDVAVGGKLKLNIKKGSPAAAAAPAPVQQASMLDFMDGGDSDFMSAPAVPAPKATSNSIMFDAFSTPAASAQDDFGFATFSAAPPAIPQQQAQAQAFDPFGMGSPPAQPQSQPVMQFSQTQFQQPPPIPQESFGQFNSPMQSPPIPQPSMMQPAMMQQQAPMIPQQSFGQFSSPMQAPPIPQSSMMQPAMMQQPAMQQPIMQQPPMQQQQYQQPMGYSAPSIPQSAPIPQQQQQQQPQIFRGIVAKAPEPIHIEPAAAQVEHTLDCTV